ncbi:hypothetical protein [Ectothiorhodospira mobilis]|uniref:hypothetical protein n=1 Tax=Ectothiorhodospira mobilis TaxID=195064 RepID=UPI00190461B2|nr:hypothetical protein [Ectothiorhodospira mobilis]MBK1690985.1 hypothetical protein [Ectothiorhodospira mobilis]
MGEESIERLGRIEERLEAQQRELTQIRGLLSRMVRVEERMGGIDNRMERLEGRVAKTENAVDEYRTGHRVMSWMAGLASSGLAAFLGWFLGAGL